MKICRMCAREFTPEDFGSQAYCRECWRKYDNVKKTAKRQAARGNKAASTRKRVLDLLIAQHPDHDSVALWKAELAQLGRIHHESL